MTVRTCRIASHFLFRLAFLLLVFSPDVAFAGGNEKDPAIAEGVQLHDKGEYDKAIAKYEEALQRNPQNVAALYEMAFSFYAKKDLRKSLEIAQKGATFKDRLRPGLFMLIGNIQDQLGNKAAAIDAYEAGIREAPAIALLHFNLGVTYFGNQEWKKARTALERGVALKPDHASGHLYLAKTLQNEGLKVPAFLAFFRFLTLEPTGPRSKEAIEAIDGLFHRGYSKDEKTGNTTLSLGKDDKKEEGDFDAAELGMLMVQAAGELEDNPEKLPEPGATIKKLSDSVKIAAETTKASPSAFVTAYYLPYFRELAKRNFVEPACYFVWQASGTSGVLQWLKKNKPEVSSFLAWSKTFKWAQAVK